MSPLCRGAGHVFATCPSHTTDLTLIAVGFATPAIVVLILELARSVKR